MKHSDVCLKIDNETELKRLSIEHASKFLSLINTCRPYLRQWLGWLDHTKSLEDVEKFIISTDKEFTENKALALWIWHQNKIVGIIHLRDIDHTNRKAMIGYWVGENFRGKSFAKKATKAVCSYAFNERKINRIEIRCATANKPSQAVPIALGFQQEGTLRDNEWLYDHFVDHVVFSMLAKDWP